MLDESIEQFLASEAAEDQARKRATKDLSLPSVPFAPNREFVLALENALAAAKLNLQYFAPLRRLQPLGPQEIRFYSRVPEQQAHPDSARRRSTILNLDTQAVFTEVPREVRQGRLHRPAVRFDLDEGSEGLPAAQLLCMGVGLRCSLTEDPWHHMFNDLKLALVSNGVWVCVCERLVAYNSPAAPWHGHGFFGQVQSAAAEYFKVRDHTCSLFQLFFKDSGWRPLSWKERHRFSPRVLA